MNVSHIGNEFIFMNLILLICALFNLQPFSLNSTLAHTLGAYGTYLEMSAVLHFLANRLE